MTRKRDGIITVAAIWDSAWKGYAIWKAVRRRQYRWIPPLLIVNSVGLLPMLYVFFLAKRGGRQETPGT